MRRYLVSLTLLAIMLSAAPGCSESSTEVVAGLGEEFALSVGQTATITGEDLSIQFMEVVSDSRCPSGATCIWAGEASCLIEITTSDSVYSMVLTQPGSNRPNEAAFAHYSIAFDIQPYPELGREIETGDYRLNLTVAKTAQ